MRDPRGVAIGEVGLHRDVRAHLLARGDEERRVIRLGVEDGAHRVADSGSRVEVHVSGAARGLREAVGHADHDRFLESQYVREVAREIAQHRELSRSGIAEDRGHPVGPEQVESRLADRRHGARIARGDDRVAGAGGRAQPNLGQQERQSESNDSNRNRREEHHMNSCRVRADEPFLNFGRALGQDS